MANNNDVGDLMIIKTNTCALYGIEGHVIEVETDLSKGLPGFDIVGLIQND